VPWKWLEDCQVNGGQVWGQAAVVGNDECFMLADYNLLDGTDEWLALTAILGVRASQTLQFAQRLS